MHTRAIPKCRFGIRNLERRYNSAACIFVDVQFRPRACCSNSHVISCVIKEERAVVLSDFTISSGEEDATSGEVAFNGANF